MKLLTAKRRGPFRGKLLFERLAADWQLLQTALLHSAALAVAVASMAA